MKIREIWDLSEICQMDLENYVKIILESINEAKAQEKRNKLKKEELARSIFQEIIIKVLKSSYYDDLFERIRFHIMKDDKKQNHGYCCIFSLILVMKGNHREKVQAFNDIYLALQEIFSLKGHIKTNFLMFKSILILYIDIVSFLTIGYLININRGNDPFFVEKLDEISKCFRIENRVKLCEELLGQYSSSHQFFILDDLLRDKEILLDNSSIREKLIEMDHGKGGIKNQITKNHEKNTDEIQLIKGDIISENEVLSIAKAKKKNK